MPRSKLYPIRKEIIRSYLHVPVKRLEYPVESSSGSCCCQIEMRKRARDGSSGGGGSGGRGGSGDGTDVSNGPSEAMEGFWPAFIYIPGFSAGKEAFD
jgi:uncharacterized membrane protein YgcG